MQASGRIDGTTSTELARAKINLTLAVRGRRSDGFHELDSVVAFADIGDRLKLTSGVPTAVHVEGPFAAAIIGENLAAQALALIAAAAPGLVPGRLTLSKMLPVAAGVGGGSADAAAVFRLVQAAHPQATAHVDWMGLAARLGSDVPVCFANVACLMTGRGDVLAALDAFDPLPAVLINPQVPVPTDKTRQVFAHLGAQPLKDAPTVAAPAHRSVVSLDMLRTADNDLEPAATIVVPAIATVLAAARADPRTLLARLSGAGPTCFALTKTQADADALAEELSARHPSWWVRATQLS